MPDPLRATSLKTRVLFLVSLLIVVAIWGLAAVVAKVLQSDLEKIVAQHLSATLDYVADDIDQGMQNRINALNKLAARITPEIQADPAKVQRLLMQSDLAATLFPEGVTCSNRQGLIFADNPELPGRSGGSLADRQYFREIMAGAPLAISSPIVGRFVRQPVVILAVPVSDAQGVTSGMLVGASTLSDQDLFGQLEKTKIGRTGYFIVASPRDRLIVSATDRTRILTPMAVKGTNRLLDRRLEEGFEGEAIATTSSGVEVLSVGRAIKNTGWIAVIGIETQEAFAPIVTLKRQIYVGALLISLLVALVLRFVLKRQLLPLGVAAQAMRRMSEGEEPLAPIPVVRRDEIGQLVDSFNQLALEHIRLIEDLHQEIAERRHSEDEVRKLNETLEQGVIDRTNQLTLANQQLEQEIAERRTAESTALDFATRLQVMTRRHDGAQELEKRRLARELHDRVSSSLTAIGLSLGLIEKQPPRDIALTVKERLSGISALLKETMSHAREISHDLHPAVLGYAGVVAALEDYGRKFSAHTGIDVLVVGEDREIRLPPEMEIALYRIAQEALTNCAKHAGATSITIELDGDSERVAFAISDDGKGFDASRLSSNGNAQGLGLLSMRERAEAIGGRLTLTAMPGTGTRISVEIYL